VKKVVSKFKRSWGDFKDNNALLNPLDVPPLIPFMNGIYDTRTN
jgi:hypothetical protein